MNHFLSESLSDYGLKLQKFSIGALDIDQDELRRKYDEIGMDTIRKMRNAQADKAVMNTLGEDWSRQKSVDIFRKNSI